MPKKQVLFLERPEKIAFVMHFKKCSRTEEETFNWKIMETINVCDIIADQEGSGLFMEFYGNGCKLYVVHYARCTP